MRITVEVNGAARSADVEDRTLLVDWLRDGLGLTGTHVGCDTSQCGCCTVHLDGEAVKACSLLAVQADGCSVVTIEGLAARSAGREPGVVSGGLAHPVQRAFAECHALQCGFCTPGMVMASAHLLRRNPDPTEAQIVTALAGNLCRCTGYVNIVAAVQRAAFLVRSEGMQR